MLEQQAQVEANEAHDRAEAKVAADATSGHCGVRESSSWLDVNTNPSFPHSFVSLPLSLSLFRANWTPQEIPSLILSSSHSLAGPQAGQSQLADLELRALPFSRVHSFGRLHAIRTYRATINPTWPA